MEHKRVWTTRRLVLLFPTRAGILPLVYIDQLPPSSRASPLALLLQRGPNCLSRQVQILIEGGYYFIKHRQLCGHYSRADTIQRADTIRGNTVYMFYENTCTCTFVVKILKEFELIVGDGAAKRVVDNWHKHLPSISHPEASRC